MSYIINLYSLISGFLTFIIKKKNSEESFQAFVKLHCFTNGVSSYFISLLHNFLSFFLNNPKKEKSLYDQNNLIKDQNVKKIVDTIKKDGYFRFENILDEGTCNNIIKYIDAINGFANRDKNLNVKLNDISPEFTFVNFHENDLLKNKDIQKIVMNDIFLKVCRKYFNTFPVITNVGIAVSYPNDEPKTEYAQLYHFDLDRIKWLKFFIYLTDVNLENGPHSYIEGTHKILSKPYEFIKRGYVRISDKEFFSKIDKKKERIITGKKGTILVGDTSAFHKGLNPVNGRRILLQVEYSNCLFGAKLDEVNLKREDFIDTEKNYRNIEKSKLFSRYNLVS